MKKSAVPVELRMIADMAVGLGRQFVAAGLESVATEAREKLDTFIDGLQKLQPQRPIDVPTKRETPRAKRGSRR